MRAHHETHHQAGAGDYDPAHFRHASERKPDVYTQSALLPDGRAKAAGKRKTGVLSGRLSSRFFTLPDVPPIARSLKHIVKYYEEFDFQPTSNAHGHRHALIQKYLRLNQALRSACGFSHTSTMSLPLSANVSFPPGSGVFLTAATPIPELSSMIHVLDGVLLAIWCVRSTHVQLCASKIEAQAKLDGPRIGHRR